VVVAEDAVVRDSILMPGVVVEPGAVVDYAIVAENCVIGAGARVGSRPEETPDKDAWGVAVVGAGVQVEPGATVPAKAMLYTDVQEVAVR